MFTRQFIRRQASEKLSVKVPDIVDLTVSFKFLNFSSQICLLFVPKISASITSYIVHIIHCILACLLWSKKSTHSLSNHGLCCFHSCRPRLSLTEVLIFSLMFSQSLLTFSSPFKFSSSNTMYIILVCNWQNLFPQDCILNWIYRTQINCITLQGRRA